MPAVAVGAAVFAGVEIATVGLAAMSTFGAIAAIGAVTAGVGVVTGNKDLVKIGGVMGIVGGIGSLAQSSGLLGTAEELATETLGAEAASSAAEAGAGAATNTTAGSVAAEATQGLINTGAPIPAAELTGAVEAAGNVSSTAAQWTATQVADDLAAGAAMKAAAAPASVFETIKAVADPVLKFSKENQMLTYGMMQVGGSFAKGLFDPTADSQKAALDARANSESAQAGLLNSYASNINQPLPDAVASASRPSVYRSGTPQYIKPQVNTGLINSVTGRVA